MYKITYLTKSGFIVTVLVGSSDRATAILLAARSDPDYRGLLSATDETVTMNFVAPDPSRFRISDCGRYLIEKHETEDGPRYSVWRYVLQKSGYESFEDAKHGAMMARMSPEVGSPDSGSPSTDPPPSAEVSTPVS